MILVQQHWGTDYKCEHCGRLFVVESKCVEHEEHCYHNNKSVILTKEQMIEIRKLLNRIQDILNI